MNEGAIMDLLIILLVMVLLLLQKGFFSGSEIALVNSDKYYFVVRSLRVANERRTGPTAEEAKFKESKPAVIDPFAGAGFVGLASAQ